MSKTIIIGKNTKQYIKTSRKISFLLLAIFLVSILYIYKGAHIIFASLPSSANFQIQNYSFGAGGTANSTSSNFKTNGIAGEVEFGQQTSSNFKVNGGLTFLQTANVPSAPIVSNESGLDYNKLKITLVTGSNPSDYQYAIAISPDGFVSTTKYVQADATLGTTPVWQTKTVWGASGFYAIGLAQNTTYSVKAASKQGNFTQSPFGPITAVTTAQSSFTFSLNRNSVSIGSLTPNNVITAGNTVTATMSTNGTGGGIVSIYGTNNGLLSSNVNYTISSTTTNLTSATEGYGIQATSVTQTTGGPMEMLSPYNGAGNNVGSVTTSKQAVFDSTGAPVTSGLGTFQIMAKASGVTKAASDYADTITVIASGTF